MNVRNNPGPWQVVVAAIVQAVSAATIFVAYSIIAVPLAEEFAPSRMVLMLGMTATALASGVLSPFLGKAIDRYSMRSLMLLGASCLVIGLLLLSLASSMLQVIAIYAIFFSVTAVLLGPMAASALIVRWFTHRRGLMIGIAGSGTAIGGLIIPPLLQGMIDEFGWRMALQMFSGIVFILTVPVIGCILIDQPEDKRSNSSDAIDNVNTVPEAKGQPLILSTAVLFQQRNFWLIAVTLCMIFAGATAFSSNLLPFALEKNIDSSKGAFLLSVFAGAGFAGKLLCASFVDRIDCRFAFVLILSVFSMGVFGCYHFDRYVMLVVSCFVVGISSGGASPLWSVVLARIYGPENIGRVMGLMSLIIMLGTLLGPPIFGLVFDKTGSYDSAFLGYVLILMLVMLLLVPSIKEKSQAEKVVDLVAR